MEYRKKHKKEALSSNDIKLLIAVCVFFLAILLKFTNFAFIPQLRQNVNIMLTSGADTKEIVAVFGEIIKPESERNSDILEVFANKVLNLEEAQEEEPEPIFYEDPTSDYYDIFPVGDEVKALPTFSYEFDESSLDLVSNLAEQIDGTVNKPFEIPPPENVSSVKYKPTFSVKNPTSGTVTSVFGYRVHPLDQTTKFHTGIDIANEEGTKINSLADGVVSKIGKSSIYGNYIIIDHKDGFSSFYAHCKKILVKEGKKVKRGSQIALMGSSGYTTGSHLHFEMRKNGVIINPNNFARY